jgi:Predicted integral membrane protein (DUF2269)
VPLAVQFYDVVVWLHVSAVVLAFGPTFAYGVFIAVTQKTDPRALPAVFRSIQTIDRTMVTIGGLVVLASGIYLASDRWNFDEVFIGVGIAAILILLGLLYGVFIPGERSALELSTRDIERAGPGEVKLSEEFDAVNGRLAKVGALAGLIVILTIYFMAAKPFL